MYKNYDRNKSLDTIRTRINYILDICQSSGSIVKALEDEKLAQSSIIMHLIASQEQLERIQNNGDIETLSIFTPDDIRGLSTIRNIASHDYEDLNFSIIENVIRDYLPSIKEKIDNFLKKNDNKDDMSNLNILKSQYDSKQAQEKKQDNTQDNLS